MAEPRQLTEVEKAKGYTSVVYTRPAHPTVRGYEVVDISTGKSIGHITQPGYERRQLGQRKFRGERFVGLPPSPEVATSIRRREEKVYEREMAEKRAEKEVVPVDTVREQEKRIADISARMGYDVIKTREGYIFKDPRTGRVVDRPSFTETARYPYGREVMREPLPTRKVEPMPEELVREVMKEREDIITPFKETVTPPPEVKPFIVSPSFLGLWEERKEEMERVLEREAGLKAMREHIEYVSPVALIVSAGIERGNITTLKEIREAMPERTRERDQLEQDIIDKYKEAISTRTLESAKVYFPALVTHREEMEIARKQLKEQEIAMGTRKGEFLLTGLAPALHPVKTALFIGAVSVPVLGVAGRIPIVGKIVTSKYLTGTLLGLYGAGEVIGGIKKIEEEPTYYKRPSGILELGLGTVTEVGAFITGAAVSRAVLGTIPRVRVKRKVKVDEVGWGKEEIVKRTRIDILRGRGTEGVRAYRYVSPTGRVEIRYAKLFDFPKKPIKVVTTTVTKPTEIISPFYAPTKVTTPSFIRPITPIGYAPIQLGVGKTYRPEVFGYTKSMIDKMKRDIAMHLKKKFKTPFKVDKVIKSKVETKHQLPKAPKGYKWVEREMEVKDSLGRVQIQIQIQLVKLQEPEVRLKRVLMQRQQQLQRQRQVSKQVSIQKPALTLNQLLGTESIQKSKLSQLLGVGLLSAQEQAQLQKLKLVQEQRLGLVSLQTPILAQAQAQKQKQVFFPLLALDTAQALEQAQRLAQAQELVQPQVQVQAQVLELEAPLITTGILIPPEAKRKPTRFVTEEPKGKAYDILIRKGEKRGDKFVKVEEEGLPENKARRRLAQILDNYIEASGRIRKSNRMATELDSPPPDLRKFRSPVKKSKLPRDTIVELAKHRLDSAKEVQQISYFKELAKKKQQLQTQIGFIKTQQIKQRKKQQLQSIVATKKQQTINFISSSKKPTTKRGRSKTFKWL